MTEASALSGVGARRQRRDRTVEQGIAQDFAEVLLSSPKYASTEDTPKTRLTRLASDSELKRLCSLGESDPSLSDLSKIPSHPNLRARSPKASLFEQQSYRTPTDRSTSCAPNGRASVRTTPPSTAPPSLRGQIEFRMMSQSGTMTSPSHGHEGCAAFETLPNGLGALKAQDELVAFPAPKRQRQKATPPVCSLGTRS